MFIAWDKLGLNVKVELLLLQNYSKGFSSNMVKNKIMFLIVHFSSNIVKNKIMFLIVQISILDIRFRKN